MLCAKFRLRLRLGAVAVHSLEASLVAAKEYPRARQLPTRVGYHNKNAAMPWKPAAAKAPLVALVARDPDLLSLWRDAPTMTPARIYVLLAVTQGF